MRKKRIIYYEDELNDEFSEAKIRAKRIDGKYRYVRDGFFAKIYSFIVYRLLFMPFSFLYMKIKYGFSVKNRKVLKSAKDGYFVYANHTAADADPYLPTMAAFPKNVFVVVHPANVSMPILGKITPYMGALPLPDDAEATRNFLAAMEKRCKQKSVICIYPEAHIWPMCTFIRDFKDTSFRYPIKFDKPVFCFTNVYTARKLRKTPKLTVYVDGPFYPDRSLPVGAARKKLRDEAYATMCERAKLSDYDGVVYVKTDRNEPSDESLSFANEEEKV